MPDYEGSSVHKKRVVCIEDDAEMIELVRLILARRGFEVIGAMNGEAGLRAIADTQPDLVLLDLMMPEMSGWDVYQRMKADEHMKDIPVIVITAKVQNIDKALGLHIAKVQDYITKPLSPSDLLQSVERVLNPLMGGHVIFVSGGRGVGKTTLCGQVARRMRAEGWRVGGFLSLARLDASGRKVGIDLLDLASGERHPLAEVHSQGPTDVGRYAFHQEAVRLGENLARAAPPDGLLVVDELGPLELERGQGWVGALEALQAGRFRAALVVVRPELLEKARRRIAPGALPALHVTHKNRDSLAEEAARWLSAL